MPWESVTGQCSKCIHSHACLPNSHCILIVLAARWKKLVLEMTRVESFQWKLRSLVARSIVFVFCISLSLSFSITHIFWFLCTIINKFRLKNCLTANEKYLSGKELDEVSIIFRCFTEFLSFDLGDSLLQLVIL